MSKIFQPAMELCVPGQPGAAGSIYERLRRCNFDLGHLRPFYEGPHNCVSLLNAAGERETHLTNAEALLPLRTWEDVDTRVREASRHPLQLWDDLVANTSVYTPAGGLGTLTLTHQRGNDVGSTTVSMTGEVRDDDFRAGFDSVTMPIPLISCGFNVGMRENLASGSQGGPTIENRQINMATRRVMETVEDFVAGISTFTAMGGSVQGYRNFTYAGSYTITAPTAGGWKPSTLEDEFLDMREAMVDKKRNGPFVAYVGSGWDRYLDKPYTDGTTTFPKTLRQQLLGIDGISRITTIRRMSGFTIMFVQLDSANAEAVQVLRPTPIQWTTPNTMRSHIRIIAAMYPRLFAEQNGDSGVLVANVA